MYCYASKDGFKMPEIKEHIERKYKYIEISHALANEMARRIVEMASAKIPTRNLNRFDIRLEPVWFAEQHKIYSDADYPVVTATTLAKIATLQQEMVDSLRDKEKETKSVDQSRTYARGYQSNPGTTTIAQTILPVSFMVTMTYIFRDDAKLIYEQEIKQIS
jgi:hypothetical protein